MFARIKFIWLPLALLCAMAYAQEGFPLFTTDFPQEEFAARRAEVYKVIGENGVAVLQGAPSPSGYTRFRQSNKFYYLCGGQCTGSLCRMTVSSTAPRLAASSVLVMTHPASPLPL